MNANGVSYVTKKALQKRYPSKARLIGQNEKYFEEYYSSIDLSNDYFNKEKNNNQDYKTIEIVHVSNAINNHVKGHDEIIKAVHTLKTMGIEAKVTFIGDGDMVKKFKENAQELGIEKNISFIGKISDKDVLKEELLKREMFIFPTRAEGLPRALIEAMALGLPCISTNINGMPELLNEEQLIKVGDIKDLVNKIIQLHNNKLQKIKLGRENRKKAREYLNEKLDPRRKNFYKKLRTITERNLWNYYS